MQQPTPNSPLRNHILLTAGLAILCVALSTSTFAPTLQLQETINLPSLLPAPSLTPSHAASQPNLAQIRKFDSTPPPLINALYRIDLSNTILYIDGSGSIPVGFLTVSGSEISNSPNFQLTNDGEHNDYFEIQGDVLSFRNLASPAHPKFNIRIESIDTDAPIIQDFSIETRAIATNRQANWQASSEEEQDLIGYGEHVAHYANAHDQGWDLSVIGNAGIAFSQASSGFEISATGVGHAGRTASISEISIRPSTPRHFRLDSLGLSIFSDENSKVTISGYREGVAVAPALSSNVAELPTAARISPDHDLLDEIVLTFHPAIETAELVSLACSELL